MLDRNRDMKNVQLSRILRYSDLDMKDTVKSRPNTEDTETFVRGSRQMDGTCATFDTEISAACFLPFYFGVGH